MKAGRVALVGIFCIAMLVFSGAYAAKPENPGKPGAPETECITFTGDLVGRQQVEGCCPNRGPFPSYALTLPDGFCESTPCTREGHLYVNIYRPGRIQDYMVQFWTDDDEVLFEVIGGDVVDDRKTKTVTVTFTPQNSHGCWDHETPIVCSLSFKLVITSDLTDCPL